MNKYIYNLKYIVLGTLVSLTSCVDNDLPGVGDIADLTGPTPSFNFQEVTTSQFDCDDMLLFANYQISLEGASNLSVNGTQYEWAISELNSDGTESPVEGLQLINSDLPVLETLIDAQQIDVVALENTILNLETGLPCETDPVAIEIDTAEIEATKASLVVAEAALTEENLTAIADLESQISALPEGTVNDQNVIVSVGKPGIYRVKLTVTDNNGLFASIEEDITILMAIPTIPVPEIGEPSFELNSLIDGSGDGRDSWRAPSNTAWSPLGGGTTVIQINTASEEGILPDGVKAAKFPAGGGRVAYQEIEVTPGAEYILTYFSAFELTEFADLTVSILNPETPDYTASLLEENIIARRVENNVGRVENVFRQHSITFAAGENESVIIYVTNSGDESRLDLFDILVKQ